MKHCRLLIYLNNNIYIYIQYIGMLHVISIKSVIGSSVCVSYFENGRSKILTVDDFFLGDQSKDSLYTFAKVYPVSLYVYSHENGSQFPECRYLYRYDKSCGVGT